MSLHWASSSEHCGQRARPRRPVDPDDGSEASPRVPGKRGGGQHDRHGSESGGPVPPGSVTRQYRVWITAALSSEARALPPSINAFFPPTGGAVILIARSSGSAMRRWKGSAIRPGWHPSRICSFPSLAFLNGSSRRCSDSTGPVTCPESRSRPLAGTAIKRIRLLRKSRVPTVAPNHRMSTGMGRHVACPAGNHPTGVRFARTHDSVY